MVGGVSTAAGTVEVVLVGISVVDVCGGNVDVVVDVVEVLDVSGTVVLDVVVELVVSAIVVVVDVVVSGGNTTAVVVVSAGGGIGTSMLAVAVSTRGWPPVTKRCAPCGSGPAGTPRYTSAAPGADVEATTVMVPGIRGIVVCAVPLTSVSTTSGESCPLISSDTRAPSTGCAPANNVTVICPATSTVAAISH